VAVVVAAASVDPTAVAADPKESVHSIGSYCQPASRRQSWPLPATWSFAMGSSGCPLSAVRCCASHVASRCSAPPLPPSRSRCCEHVLLSSRRDGVTHGRDVPLRLWQMLY